MSPLNEIIKEMEDWEREMKARLNIPVEINHEPITPEEIEEVLAQESEEQAEALMRGEL